MGKFSKNISLLLVTILVISSLMMVEYVSAQTIPIPSVPEFTLKVVEHPYDIAPTTTIDPYTGKTTITNYGYHVENKSVEIAIKNQPFNSFNDINGNSIGLYYNVTVKGHFETNWIYYFNNSYRGLLNASDSDYTVISIPFGYHPTVPLGGYPLEGVNSGQLDLRVQAQIGYYNKEYTGMFAPVPGGDFYFLFTGETSDWSNTQTITIPDGSISTSTSPNPTSNPTPTPTVPEFSWLMIIPLLLSILAVAVIIRKRRASQKFKTTSGYK